jgi:hypothetical protein
MHVFIGPAKTSIRAMLNFPGIYVCAFYPIPRLYVQTEHKSVVAVVLSIFNWKSGKKMIFSYNFLSPLLSSCTLAILWLQGRASRAQLCFLPTPSLRSDE